MMQPTFQSLVVGHSGQRLDCGNGVLIGLPAYICRLFLTQSCSWFSTSLRPCLWRVYQPSFTACSRTHQVQDCRPGTQGSPWLCTVLPWSIHLRCWPSKSPRTSPFLQQLPRPACSSLLHCWQPSDFGCWPSGVEMFASGGNVSTISGNLPHSSQDVSVYCVISWHWIMYIFVSAHSP